MQLFLFFHKTLYMVHLPINICIQYIDRLLEKGFLAHGRRRINAIAAKFLLAKTN